MNWFKHLARARHDPFIADLLEAHRGDGYLFYFGTLEIYAENWRPDMGWFLDVSLSFLKRELHFYHLAKMKKIIRFIASWPNLESSEMIARAGRNSGEIVGRCSLDSEEMVGRWPLDSEKINAKYQLSLHYLSTIYPKWVVNLSSQRLGLFIPNFSRIMDEYSKKAGKKREKISGQCPDSVQQRTKEKRKEKDRNRKIEEVFRELKSLQAKIDTLPQIPGQAPFDVPQFIGRQLKRMRHPCAIRDATAALADQWPPEDPWKLGPFVVDSVEQRYSDEPIDHLEAWSIFDRVFPAPKKGNQ